ncbi:uncharacterized protein LOC128548604 [Mercenaria mercenaria]|uniref:uncharacterized protein LOC128548604 n=1 Tax=Mercenaria mercenaria TaxID=6596 RepID=UPI00234FB0EA|nr:uncharacterized protein LOC128548604 [Mercenaria mercenaria]
MSIWHQRLLCYVQYIGPIRYVKQKAAVSKDTGEILKPQLQQYEEINKEKGSVHSYEGLDAVTKRTDVEKRQLQKYDSIEIVKGPIRYVKHKAAVSKDTDNKDLQTQEKRTMDGINCLGEEYENLP